MLYCLYSRASERPVLASHEEGYQNKPGWKATAISARGTPIQFRVTDNKNTVRNAYKSPHPNCEVIPLVMLYSRGFKNITVNGVPFVDDRDPDAPD